MLARFLVVLTTLATFGCVNEPERLTPPSDQVLSVIVRCEQPGFKAPNGPEFPTKQYSGVECDARDPNGAFRHINRRLVLTVRSPSGGMYTIDAPLETAVKPGDPWPPRK